MIHAENKTTTTALNALQNVADVWQQGLICSVPLIVFGFAVLPREMTPDMSHMHVLSEYSDLVLLSSNSLQRSSQSVRLRSFSEFGTFRLAVRGGLQSEGNIRDVESRFEQNQYAGGVSDFIMSACLGT